MTSDIEVIEDDGCSICGVSLSDAKAITCVRSMTLCVDCALKWGRGEIVIDDANAGHWHEASTVK